MSGQRDKVTVVLDPYNDYRRPEHEKIPFDASLRSLLNQAYPAECVTILITCLPDHSSSIPISPEAASRVRCIDVPSDSGYYQKKNYGAFHADTEIVLLADGDCLYPENWIEEMTAAFERGGDRVAAVQGLSRFCDGPVSFALDAMYWTCGFEPEGPIRQIYSVHNLALRRSLLSIFRFEDSPIRAGLERIISPKIRGADFLIWHNRRTRVIHDTSGSFDDFWKQAVGRGHHRMILWQRHPKPLDRALIPLSYFSIPIYTFLLYVRDLYRLFYALFREPSMGRVLRLPVYVLFDLAFHLAGSVGMARVLKHMRNSGAFPQPEPTYALGSSTPSSKQ